MDAVLHVVRCFDSGDVTHVAGDVDPRHDIETVDLELVLADLALAERRLERLERAVKTGDKAAAPNRDTTKRLVEWLSEGRPARDLDLDKEERASLAEAQLITLKPVLFVCNVDEAGIHGNSHVDEVRQVAEEQGAGMVIICAEVEAEIALLDADDQTAFLDDLGLNEPGLSALAREAYALLHLDTFFTVGPKEIRAWTVRSGSTASRAAGLIHTDFERGFIRAEVYVIPDLLEYGSEVALRAAGKMRVEGRDYVVRDGDVIYFRFNV